jgi:A/G-specific adenine glycosylase
MLQQTQVNQGLPYYEKFTEAFPTVFDLAKASEERVLKLWQGLGYYSRARNLHSTAKYVAHHLNGQFPQTYKELLMLKGVGDYTASAIASFAYKEPKAVLDGNVYRVLARYFGMADPINSTHGTKVFKQLAQELLDRTQPDTYNQAIMEFGSQQCKPVNPKCYLCPLEDSCRAVSTGQVETLPVKLKKTKVQIKYFNYLVFIDPQLRTLIEKRSAKGIWQNLYQFPLVETKRRTKPKEFDDLLDSTHFSRDDIDDFFLFNTSDIVHKLSHRSLHTKFWIVLLKTPLQEGILYSDLRTYPVPVLIANFLRDFDFKKL